MDPIRPLRLKGKNHGKLKFFAGVLVFILLSVGLFFWKSTSNTSVVNFVLNRGGSLEADRGRVNILLLGIAGGRHDGPNLTDTIMVASIDTKSHKTDLISLPRDLWVDEVKAKVNALYEIGLARGNGLSFAEEEIGKILGIEIPYAIRLDFSGFTKAIDTVGGIDVDVTRAFDDYGYPVEGKADDLCGNEERVINIDEAMAKELGAVPGEQRVLIGPDGKIATSSGSLDKNLQYSENQVLQLFPCRYEHISFEEGLTHLGGEMTLKFVRSRHGTNNEGTDFARSARQQQGLQAFKNKVLSFDTLTDIGKMTGLARTFGASLDTDIPQNKYLEFANLAKNISGIKSYVIDSKGKDPLLVTPPAGLYGAWVLIPPGNDFTKVRQFVSDILSGKMEATPSAGSTTLTTSPLRASPPARQP